MLMAWNEWISTLLNGLLGSVVGLLGVFGAFLLTSRHQKRQDREDRTAESVAKVVQAANSLNRRLASPGIIWTERAVVDFIESVQLFAAREGRDHRPVAEWVLRQHERVVALFDERGVWVPLVLRPSCTADFARIMGEVSGALVGWQFGERPDKWFSDQLRDERAEQRKAS
jgi:hypothetical protein